MKKFAPIDARSAAEAPTVDARPTVDDRRTNVETFDSREPGDGGAKGLAPLDSEAPDSFDQLLKKVVQPGPPTLAVGDELAGRFKIARMLGHGGMGVVYVARDATLGREVAIKVHHTPSGAERLRREAMAMARLAHPNVVTVFEVGEIANRPFVVMEYVPGTTLRAWLATPRSVRDILALLRAVGEGLAAAHDAGLIHRDIKPDNVLIGSDGRPRVGDFGLARELDSREAEELAPRNASPVLTAMTQTGALLGTPAYMAPEQLGVGDGGVDARADQFAFCVMMWEALWRVRPYAGGSLEQLRAAFVRGARRPPPAKPAVPARVRAALERGLAVDPAQRFPTMHALLAAIGGNPRPRARQLAMLGTALAIAAGAAGVAAQRASRAACDDAGVFDLSAVRTDLPEQLRRRGATAAAVRATLAQVTYATTFQRAARRACQADRARDWSPEIAAQSRACLAIIARTASLALESVRARSAPVVVRQLRGLPPPDQCLNPTYLAARPPLSGSAAQLDALTDARATLTVGLDAVSQEDAPTVRAALARLAASRAHDDPAIAAGAMVLRAARALDDGKVADSRAQLIDAYYAGRAIDDDLVSTAALSTLISRTDELALDPPTVAQWLRTALADADRVRVRSPWLAGRVYSVAATAADLAKDAEAALRFVDRARAVLPSGSPSWISTYVVEGAVKMWSGRTDEGVRAYELALAQDIEAVGPDDPDVASLLGDYAASLIDVERIEPAIAVANRALAIVDRLADPNDQRIDPIRVNLAAVLISANREPARALALLQTARANDVRRFGETNTIVANIDSNLAILYNDRGEHDRAIAALRSSLAIRQQLLGAEHPELAAVHYNLAATYRFQHAYEASIASALRAAALFAKQNPGSDRHRYSYTLAAAAANDAGQAARALELTATALAFPRPAESAQTTAWLELEHGRALIGLHRGGEARPLLAAARKRYASLEMTQRVQQCDDLLAKLAR